MTTHLDKGIGRTTRDEFEREIVVPDTIAGIHGTVPVASSGAPGKWLAALRIAVGAIFLWPFFDKLFGLGFATPAERAWIEGNSPTKGFLSHLDVGPAKGFFQSIAGAWWADWMFMIGLGAIGIAVIAGIGLRISAITGSLLMMMMWLAEWPLARFTDSGDPTGSTNPIIDYHVIYAIALIVFATTAAGTVWGLGKKWASLPLVQRNPWLR